MKKNLFYAAFALAMMASCTNEDNLVVDPVEPTPEDKVAIELGIDAPTVNATLNPRSTGSVGGTGEEGNNSETNNWNGQKLYITMVKKGTNEVTPISDTDATPLLGYNSYTYKAPATGGTGLIQIIGSNNGTDKTKHVYYPTQGTYDFYGWHVDDIATAIPNTTNPLLIENIKITGQQDIMGARTKEFTADHYNKDTNGNNIVEDFTLMQGWDFSARTARNGIKPILAFEHQLARLKFFVRAGSENTIIDSDWSNDRTDKDGVNVSSNAMHVTAITVKKMVENLTMDLNQNNAIVTTTTDTEAKAEFKLLSRNEEGDAKGTMKETLDAVAPTAVYTGTDVTKGVQVGESIMFFPWGDSKTTVDLDIELQQYVQIWGEEEDEFNAEDWDYMSQKASLKVHASSVVVDENGTKAKEFEAGKSYNVYITVYGFEKIEVTAELTAWEMGGNVDVDVEEEESKHNVDVVFDVQGLADGVTPTITVKQHNNKDCTTDTEVTVKDGKYTVESFSTLHYTIAATGYITVEDVANAGNGKTVTVIMKEATRSVSINVTDGTNSIGYDSIEIKEKDVQDAQAETITDGKVELTVGKTYTVTVTKSNYTQDENSKNLTVTENTETHNVTMTANT